MKLMRIAVLANSWKHGDYCIAGIEASSRKWVRPVTELDDGRIPKSHMKTHGRFPQLLDILAMPLHETGPDYGFACENRTIGEGEWHFRGQVDVNALLKYVEQPEHVLHNDERCVTVEEMQQKPIEERTTLQLIRVDDFEVHEKKGISPNQYQMLGVVPSGGRKLALSITDPVYFDKLCRGHKPSKSCLLTLSLGMPYKPPEWGDDMPAACWKLIAGVIEI